MSNYNDKMRHAQIANKNNIIPIGRRCCIYASIVTAVKLIMDQQINNGIHKQSINNNDCSLIHSNKKLLLELSNILYIIYEIKSSIALHNIENKKSIQYKLQINDYYKLLRLINTIDNEGKLHLGIPSSMLFSSHCNVISILKMTYIINGKINSIYNIPSILFESLSYELGTSILNILKRLKIDYYTKYSKKNRMMIYINNQKHIYHFISLVNIPTLESSFKKKQEEINNKNKNKQIHKNKEAHTKNYNKCIEALDILKDTVPVHLRTIGELRIKYPMCSLDELAIILSNDEKLSKSLNSNHITKDAIAGRLRRLILLSEEYKKNTATNKQYNK